jgi:hypothetical protein
VICVLQYFDSTRIVKQVDTASTKVTKLQRRSTSVFLQDYNFEARVHWMTKEVSKSACTLIPNFQVPETMTLGLDTLDLGLNHRNHGKP